MRILLRGFPFLLLLLLLACNSRPTPPIGVLSESKMKDLLYDIHISEAMVDNFSSQEIPYSERQRFYDQVFEKHGTSRVQYDSSLVWYGAHLDVYTEIYTEVVARYDSMLNLVKRGDYTLLHTVEDRLDHPLRIDSLNTGYCFTYNPARRMQGIIYKFRIDEPMEANTPASLTFEALIPRSRDDIKLRASLSVRYQNDTIRTISLVADSSSLYKLLPPVVDKSWRVKEYYGSIAMLEPMQRGRIPFFVVRDARFKTAYVVRDSVGDSSNTPVEIQGSISGVEDRDLSKMRVQKQQPVKMEVESQNSKSQ